MKSKYVLWIAVVLFPIALVAQTTPMEHEHSAQAAMPADCQQMMQSMEKMHASQKAMDDRLASLVREMNNARGSAKVDRMAAVINELVAQRQQMRDAMEKMMPQMMSHMMGHMQSGMHSMANCPMMSGSTASAEQHEHQH